MHHDSFGLNDRYECSLVRAAHSDGEQCLYNCMCIPAQQCLRMCRCAMLCIPSMVDAQMQSLARLQPSYPEQR